MSAHTPRWTITQELSRRQRRSSSKPNTTSLSAYTPRRKSLRVSESLFLSHLLTHSLIDSLANSLTNSLTHSLTQEESGQHNLTLRRHPAAEVPQSLSLSLTHSLTHSLHHAHTHSLTHSLITSSTHSLTHSLTHALTLSCGGRRPPDSIKGYLCFVFC